MHVRTSQHSLSASVLFVGKEQCRHYPVSIFFFFSDWDCVILCGRTFVVESNDTLLTGGFASLYCHNYG